MACCPGGFFVWVRREAASAAPPAQRMDASVVVAQPSEIINVKCGGPCEYIIQVQPSGTGTLQFTCPACNTVNQISYHGAGRREETVPPPSWWKALPSLGDSKLVSMSNREIERIQMLFDDTWKDVTTRDRSYAKPARLQVIQVHQNCNPKLWSNYARSKHCIKARMNRHHRTSCKTSEVMDDAQELFGQLDASVNEFFLFHGTKPSACESICKSDFMVKRAGANAGTLYGPGIYFGENSSKSDEYASCDSSGIFQNVFAMLICRVTCGRMLYTDAVKPDVDNIVRQCTKAGEFDSVMGDREKARGTYREIIVFKNDQAYPEYVVLYRRDDSG